jgi:DNA-directed RNA polymerase specialized sigma24 family protein
MFGRRKSREADGVELALRHLDSLYAAALRLTRDGSYAEDLVQEAFLRGYRYYRRLTAADECKALLYKIMLNLWLKDRRRAQREVSQTHRWKRSFQRPLAAGMVGPVAAKTLKRR